MSFEEIVAGQRAFFKSGATRSYEFRREQLQKLRKSIEVGTRAILESVHNDLRRPRELTRLVEVQGSLTEIDYFLENLKEWMKPEKVEKTLANILDDLEVVHEPYGVCLLITTWNYPALMFFYPLIAMLAAGNTVVIKASEVSWSTSSLMAELIRRTFDPNLVTVIQGDAQTTTDLLRQRFDKIMYTGSTQVGRLVMGAAAKNVTPCVLELGGKCPVIVEADADLEVTAKRLVWGKFFNGGQTCVAPDYVITSREVREKLVPLIEKTIEAFYGANPQKSADFGRIINERHFDRLAGLLTASSGQVLYKPAEADRADLFIPPTVIECTRDDALMQDELFGPLLPILTVDSPIDDGIRLIRDSEAAPLTSYIFTRSDKKAQRLIDETQSGSVVINEVLMHYGIDTLPFGGIGNSGMGIYRGKYGFLEFSHPKAVLKRGFFGDSLASARYPPLTEKSYKQLTSLLKRRTFPKWLGWLRPSLPSLIVGILIGVLLQRTKRVPFGL